MIYRKLEILQPSRTVGGNNTSTPRATLGNAMYFKEVSKRKRGNLKINMGPYL